jgi:DNA-binding NarL/FixJ family response regulator
MIDYPIALHSGVISSKRASDRFIINAYPHELPRLTAREREIVQLLAEGKSNKEVANALNISIKTAETHSTNIMNKLDLRSITELVRYAVRNNIVEP